MVEDEERIDWSEKFKAFVNNHVEDKNEKKLLLDYFSLAKRKSGVIQPLEVNQLYEIIYKDLDFEEEEDIEEDKEVEEDE